MWRRQYYRSLSTHECVPLSDLSCSPVLWTDIYYCDMSFASLYVSPSDLPCSPALGTDIYYTDMSVLVCHALLSVCTLLLTEASVDTSVSVNLSHTLASVVKLAHCGNPGPQSHRILLSLFSCTCQVWDHAIMTQTSGSSPQQCRWGQTKQVSGTRS